MAEVGNPYSRFTYSRFIVRLYLQCSGLAQMRPSDVLRRLSSHQQPHSARFDS